MPHLPFFALVVSLLRLATAADWPLNGYTPCAENPTRSLAGFGSDNMQVNAADLSYNDDADELWVASEGILHKFRYSTGARLDSLDLTRFGLGSTLSVAAMGASRAAVVDGQAEKIVVVGTEVGEFLVIDKEIMLTDVVPSNIAYDGAYDLFYVVDVPHKSTKHSNTEVMHDSKVAVIEMDGNSRTLFNFEDTEGIQSGFVVSSMHYASNTGTMFALCQDCDLVAEVTLSGRLRRLSVSGASLLFLADTLGYGPGEVLGISFAREGSPMLLLKQSLEVDAMCQDILPSLPVLPPPKAGPQVPNTWFSFDNYFFCGAIPMENVKRSGFKAMVFDATLRTIWAMVGGRLREYDLRGKLLRDISKDTLQRLGISGVTSMAWVRKNQLLLGMRKGNKIAHINTAPKDVMDNLSATFRAYDGDNSLADTDSWEPAGEDAEEETIRYVNRVDISQMFLVDSERFGVLPDSLGAIFYNHFAKNILFTSRKSGTYVGAMDLQGGIAMSPIDTEIEDVPTINSMIYSQTQDSFLMHNNQGPELYEIQRSPAAVLGSQTFADLNNGISAMTASTNGALLLFATSSGELNAYCGSPASEEDNLIKTIRNGESSELTLEYWDRLSVQAQSDFETDVADTRTDDIEFTSQSDVECQDPNYKIYPERISPAGACESICRSEALCGAYNYRPGIESCQLKFNCNSQMVKTGVMSGVKVLPPEPSPRSPLQSAPPDSERSGARQPWTRLNFFECKDPTITVLNNWDREGCQWNCRVRPDCGAYTWLQYGAKCHIKAGCKEPVVRWTARSGAKIGWQPPPKPPTDPTPPPITPIDIIYTILTKIACKDANKDIIRSVTQEECKQACSSDRECVAFTYNQVKQDCFLKAECKLQKQSRDDVSGLSPGIAIIPQPEIPTDPDGKLVDGWEWREGKDCHPWDNKRCGLSDNPGLKVGDIHWYRMFAHKANPLQDDGNGIVFWTPYRERRTWGGMYWKGSEILGYFDDTYDITDKNDEIEIKFRWYSKGSTQDKICGGGDAKGFRCDRCEDPFEDETGERYIYHEVRCLSGTGDFRIALLDTKDAERIEQDGYGYFNEKLLNTRGLQWRFHPHACPGKARVYPYGYDAVSCQSWIRNKIFPDWLNSHSLTIDYIEKHQDEWYRELGETRSFKERLMGPLDDGACMNLENGKWTPDDKPMKIRIKILEKGRSKTKFHFRLEFNGFVQESEEEYDNDYMPQQIDAIAIGYTNPRSFTELKLEHITDA